MAKVREESSSETKTKKPAKQKAEAAAKPQYGIDYLSKQLGKEPHLIRSQLRSREIPKDGKVYGWNTKAEADEVVSKLKERKPKAEGASTKASTKSTGKGKGAGKGKVVEGD